MKERDISKSKDKGLVELPESIRYSKYFSEDNLLQLASVPQLPMINPVYEDEILKNIFQYFSTDPEEMENELHQYARQLLDKGRTNDAWQVLLSLV